MNRAQHIAWVKQRALAELDAGSVDNAMASIGSTCVSTRKPRGTPQWS